MINEKIELANGLTVDINFVCANDNLLTVWFNESVDVDSLLSDMSCFQNIRILTRDNTVCGEYNGYTTVYSRFGQDIVFSNDGSVYEEPESIVYVPTLEDIKHEKIDAFSCICGERIVDGIDMEIDGTIEHFSYTLEDQNAIDDAFNLSQMTKMSVPLHCDNGACKLYTAEQIKKLYIMQKTNLTHHKTYFNQMKMYISSLDDMDTVKAVNYGDALTGIYLENYNTMMAQAASIITALTGGIE